MDGASVPAPLRAPRAAVPRPKASLRTTAASLLVSQAPRRAPTASVASRGASRRLRRDATTRGEGASRNSRRMLHEDRGLLCERVGVPPEFLEHPSQHLGRPCVRARERCSLRGMPRPFGGMPCPFPRMLCVFVGHPVADSATPSPFSEHRDVLAAVPWGHREARRVLGAAPSASARTTSPGGRANGKRRARTRPAATSGPTAPLDECRMGRSSRSSRLGELSAHPRFRGRSSVQYRIRYRRRCRSWPSTGSTPRRTWTRKRGW
jgi:hypothetical protein